MSPMDPATRGGDPTEMMTLMDHLVELRSRIIRSLLAIVVGLIVILVFYDPVKEFLTKPYRDLCSANPEYNCDGSLFALGPLDGFSARMKVSAYGGLIIALPVILWQIWRFVVPALNKREKQYAVPFIASSVVLFAIGGSLAYWTLGRALEFLIAWSGSDISQSYQITRYISLVTLMMLAFGVGFLSPVLLVFLQLARVVEPSTLLRQWRFAVLSIFVLAAVITPSGDPFTLMALSVPLTVLYMLSVLVGWLILRRQART